MNQTGRPCDRDLGGAQSPGVRSARRVGPSASASPSLELCELLIVEIGRLRSELLRATGSLPWPCQELVSDLRRLHQDGNLAALIERLVDE